MTTEQEREGAPQELLSRGAMVKLEEAITHAAGRHWRWERSGDEFSIMGRFKICPDELRVVVWDQADIPADRFSVSVGTLLDLPTVLSAIATYRSEQHSFWSRGGKGRSRSMPPKWLVEKTSFYHKVAEKLLARHLQEKWNEATWPNFDIFVTVGTVVTIGDVRLVVQAGLSDEASRQRARTKCDYTDLQRDALEVSFSSMTLDGSMFEVDLAPSKDSVSFSLLEAARSLRMSLSKLESGGSAAAIDGHLELLRDYFKGSCIEVITQDESTGEGS